MSVTAAKRFFSHPQAPLADAKVVVVPLPYDGTASYVRGTRKAPAAIVKASDQLEYYEEELGWEPTVELELHSLQPLWCAEGSAPEQYLDTVALALADIPAGAVTVGVGGEHSVTPVLAADRMKTPGTVVVIDAHPDLRDSYDNTKMSHACASRRLYEQGHSLIQIGLGLTSAGEAAFVRDNPRIAQYFAAELEEAGAFDRLCEKISKLTGEVYLSVDCDGICTSVMPGVGTPVPGGLSWHRLTRLTKALLTNTAITLTGMDVVELRPIKCNPLSEFTAAKLIQKCISYYFHGRRK